MTGGWFCACNPGHVLLCHGTVTAENTLPCTDPAAASQFERVALADVGYQILPKPRPDISSNGNSAPRKGKSKRQLAALSIRLLWKAVRRCRYLGHQCSTPCTMHQEGSGKGLQA